MAAFFAILKSHENALAVLLQEAAAAGAAAVDPARLAQARDTAVRGLTENYVRRLETAW